MYVVDEFCLFGGGFYVVVDVEFEEEEGKYYCWDCEEICELFGEKDFEFFL